MTGKTSYLKHAAISSLGASGDGKVSGSEEFVPFALPGEEVTLDASGKILKIDHPSPERVEPRCAVFTRCGGCRMQHLNNKYYQQVKLESLGKTLKQRSIDIAISGPEISKQVRDDGGLGGIDIAISEPVFIPEGTRRRAEFAFKGKGLFGFHELKSHKILPIEDCLLLEPRLKNLLEPLRRFPWKGEGSVLVTLCENGADLFIKSSCRKLDLELDEAFAELLRTTEVARITWNNGLLLEKFPLYIEIGGEAVVFKSGSFLQPSKAGEKALQDLVLAEIPESAKAGTPATVVDLFCGLGTFTLPLKAVGYDLAVPKQSERQPRSERRLRPGLYRRDLFKEPLTAAELKPYTHVVLDPPRAGAIEQVQVLAQADGIEKIVYVSCNPATFARDAKVLIDGGYRLSKLTPVDQFIYSPHLELVGVFER